MRRPFRSLNLFRLKPSSSVIWRVNFSIIMLEYYTGYIPILKTIFECLNIWLWGTNSLARASITDRDNKTRTFSDQYSTPSHLCNVLSVLSKSGKIWSIYLSTQSKCPSLFRIWPSFYWTFVRNRKMLLPIRTRPIAYKLRSASLIFVPISSPGRGYFRWGRFTEPYIRVWASLDVRVTTASVLSIQPDQAGSNVALIRPCQCEERKTRRGTST